MSDVAPVAGAARVALAPHLQRVVTRLRTLVAALANGDGALDGAVEAIDHYLTGLHVADVPGGARPAPIDLVIERFGLDGEQVDLLVLAGLADEHEAFATLLRVLHPERRPLATLGLIAQVAVDRHRDDTVATALTGAAQSAGLIEIDPAEAIGERSVHLPAQLWPALCGIDVWPSTVRRRTDEVVAAGLEGWMAAPEQVRLAALLRARTAHVVVVTSPDHEAALNRARALARHGAVDAIALEISAAAGPAAWHAIVAHAAARDQVPIVVVPPTDRIERVSIPAVLAGPVVVCVRTGVVEVSGGHPMIGVSPPALSARDRRRMWAELLPQVEGAAPELAARHPVEPSVAAAVARDVLGSGREATIGLVDEVVRSRGRRIATGGAVLVTPTARWADLVVTERQSTLLHAAVDRVVQRSRVLDEWGFLRDRRGSRGVRVLMTGPPGTGKTLSAEVLASEIGGVDLLVVDLSKVVSKWIGETERNLSQIFDVAEHCVVFFDEADALFGRRTAVTDAHDRYANLETAYLLTRLEQFDGLAVLASNLKGNIDPAFLRRMDVVVDFREPGPAEREELWRRHVPAGAPVDPRVRFHELATRFDVPGGLIRNAVIGAAFLAAGTDALIRHDHFVTAMRNEYEKAGLAFPESRLASAAKGAAHA